MSSPKLNSKRTRKPVGNTNRKQLHAPDGLQTTSSIGDLRSITSTASFSSSFSSINPTSPQKAPTQKSPPKVRSPSPTKNKFHTTSSEMKMHSNAADNDVKRKDQENLHKLRCEFVETFEEGKTPIKMSTNYSNPDSRIPPTRFSSNPPFKDTYHLTVGERGTTHHVSDNDRFITTKQVPIEENRAVRDERTQGRLERIRQNNARVEDVTREENAQMRVNDQRRVQTVMRQQQQYQQAIETRIAKGLD